MVVTHSDGDRFLFLNPTAAWLWHRKNLLDLEFAYAKRFGISLQQARYDVKQSKATWGKSAARTRILSSVLPAPPNDLVSVSDIKFQIHQSTYRIVLHTAALVDELLPRLRHLRISDSLHPTHTFRLYEAHNSVHIEKDKHYFANEPLTTGARSQLLQEITRLAEPDRNFTAILHAGVIGTSEECLILAGPSFSGKSTLCKAFLQNGILCYSDDSACLVSPYFHVAGMPFSLSLRETPRWLPSNLDGCSPTAPVKALVFVAYRPEAATTVLSPILGIFETLLQLQNCGFWVDHRKSSIANFLHFLSQIPSYRLIYSDLAEATRRLLMLLQGSSNNLEIS